MANAFVLPATLNIDLSGDTFSLQHDGDVVLEQTFGRPIGEVRAAGDLDLKLDCVTGKVSAGGVLRVHGTVDADVLQGREIVLDAGTITARAIHATECIIIGAAKLKVDIVLAPKIEIDPKCSGRVTVIESLNELAATRVRGGYSLAEYDEDFGNAEEFLAARGVSPLGDAPPPHDSEPEIVADGDDDDDLASDDDDDLAEAADETEEIPRDDAPDVQEPLSLADEDLTAVAQDEAEDTLFAPLTEALGRITSCYDDELPPPVETLQTLIGARDYATLRGQITDVWTGLLGYHQQKGIRPHHQVTHAFNVIHGLVSEG